MPFVPGDVFKPLSLGNINGIPDAWVGNGIREFDGSEQKPVYGLAKLTDQLQTSIPLIIPSWRKDQVSFPDRNLVLSTGTVVNYVGFRLPEYGNAFEGVSTPYGLLPTGCTIIGTTGENLKVSPTTGTTHTVTTPAIACASNAYQPDASAFVWRAPGVADQASPSLLTTIASPTTLQLTVSNAGNTAVGNGIRLSQTGAIAFVLVTLWVASPQAPLRLREIELPIPPV